MNMIINEASLSLLATITIYYTTYKRRKRIFSLILDSDKKCRYTIWILLILNVAICYQKSESRAM